MGAFHNHFLHSSLVVPVQEGNINHRKLSQYAFILGVAVATKNKRKDTGKHDNYNNLIKERIIHARKKAVDLLVRQRAKWRDIIDAYFLLRKYEAEIGFPFTYNMVEEIVKEAERIIKQNRKRLKREERKTVAV